MTASLQLKKRRRQGKLQGNLFFIHLPSFTEPAHRSYVHEDSTW